MTETEIVERYFEAFNADDSDAMLALVSEDITHHPNEGEARHGRDAFAAFLAEMDRAYEERADDLTIFSGPEGHAAAEFIIEGRYIATQDGLPEANGQTYELPVGSFFEIEDGRITRVTTYYNLSDWTRQVEA